MKIKKSVLSVMMFFLINVCITIAVSKEEAPTRYYTYDSIYLGARPVALGGAFVAVADNADSPFWNPAGLNQMTTNSLSFMLDLIYQSDVLWDDLMETEPLQAEQFVYLSFASQKGAVSWRRLADYSYSDFSEEIIGTQKNEKWNEVEVKINEYAFSACRLYSKSLMGGINMGYLSGRIAETKKSKINDVWDQLESNISDGSGFTLDWGFIYVFNKFFHLGAMFENFPGYIYWDDYKTEQLPSTMTIGFAMKLTDLFTFSTDYEKRYYEKADYQKIYHIGLEQIIFDTVFLRGGIYGSNLNQTKEITYTFGVGYKKEDYIVDLAIRKYFLAPDLNESATNFICSFSMPF